METLELTGNAPVAELLERAANGDQRAWEALVDRFSGLVWSVARSFRLGEASAADVSQTTWLRLLENCDKIRDPDRLAGWLATTARREALRILRDRKRAIPSEHVPETADDAPEPWHQMIRTEQADAVKAAFDSLSGSDQQLLRLLTADPALSYEDIAAITDRPVGSIGPTRARALERMRRQLAAIEASSSAGTRTRRAVGSVITVP